MKRAVPLVAALLLVFCVQAAGGEQGPALSIEKAEKLVMDGNQRFVAGTVTHPNTTKERLAEVLAGQHPYATVLSCSDSRVPVERIFDAGFGDLFIVRVAGNVVSVDELGSIEYGTGHLGTPLLVVLGHTSCGAVTAAVEGAKTEGMIPKLLQQIAPAVNKAKAGHPDYKGKTLIDASIKENVWQGINSLLTHSETVKRLVAEHKLKVVGAIYHLDSGQVEWLGTHPNQVALLSEE